MTGNGCLNPICFDKKYRDKNGDWVLLEEYIDAGNQVSPIALDRAKMNNEFPNELTKAIEKAS